MNPIRGLPLALVVSVAGVLLSASGPPAGAANQARITDIQLHVTGKGPSIVIEVSEPAPYVATQPDPVTVLVEFRNTASQRAARPVARSARSPISAVFIEPGESPGAPITRVRIALAQPLVHHVRSERNKVIVE